MARTWRPGPVCHQHRTSDEDPPVRKAAQAEYTVVPDEESSLAGTSTAVSTDQYCAPQLHTIYPVSFGLWRPILPVSLQLPRFTTHNFARDIGLSSSVATQRYPSSPGSRLSTLCLDMSSFDSEGSESAAMGSRWDG